MNYQHLIIFFNIKKNKGAAAKLINDVGDNKVTLMTECSLPCVCDEWLQASCCNFLKYQCTYLDLILPALLAQLLNIYNCIEGNTREFNKTYYC